ncbi:MAG: ParB/RepB/Spo0J family partition protein [Planctomycetota bacterium]|nr:ParB/RepB/Spo0J family partition protein [Planctomycetota bacterium]
MVNRHLGRDFDSLLENTSKQKEPSRSLNMSVEIPVERIEPNPWQPRKEFDEEKLAELATSIKNSGVISPIVVRREGDRYVLVAGERRLKAAKIAEIKRIPAIVRNVDDREMVEIALVENIQREDLNPMDKALAYHNLMTRFDYTQEQVSERLGQKRSTVANFLRLLKLPGEVQQSVREGSITMGHARALLSIEDMAQQLRVAERIQKDDLTVREVERIVSKAHVKGTDRPKKVEAEPDPHIADVEERLRQYFGTRVVVRHGKKKGKIVIDYYDTADLNRILDLLEG